MNDWRNLKRHPLSAEYKDLTGPAWYGFCLSMKRIGFLAHFPIVLHEGMVLDGWQRQRAAVECDIIPEYIEFPEMPLANTFRTPASYVEAVNDQRRHETTAEREARIKRVADGIAGGKSRRKIAEEEGVSRRQIDRDAEAAGSGGAPPAPPDGKVTGKDGKRQAATKAKPRCARCLRLWPNEDKSTPGCVRCHELRSKDRKPEEPPEVQETDEVPPAAVVDDSGRPVPENMLAVFRLVPQFKLFEQQLTRAAKTAKGIENASALKSKKPLQGQRHYGEMFGAIKNARFRVRAMRPALVCGECKGMPGVFCSVCDHSGFLTVEEVEAREKL